MPKNNKRCDTCQTAADREVKEDEYDTHHRSRNPLISVVQMQNHLKARGFKTASGNPLDWSYVSKMVRKLNREKALAVNVHACRSSRRT
jgi:hypothetical protein